MYIYDGKTLIYSLNKEFISCFEFVCLIVLVLEEMIFLNVFNLGERKIFTLQKLPMPQYIRLFWIQTFYFLHTSDLPVTFLFAIIQQQKNNVGQFDRCSCITNNLKNSIIKNLNNTIDRGDLYHSIIHVILANRQ